MEVISILIMWIILISILGISFMVIRLLIKFRKGGLFGAPKDLC